MKLYYNAMDPIIIMKTMLIRPSWINGRSRGVSMSSQIIDSHGPFTFCFKDQARWVGQFTQVQYGQWDQVDELHKIEMFADEYEWWSPRPVQLSLSDIEVILFRKDSPGAKIYPRIAARNMKELVARSQRRLTTRFPRVIVRVGTAESSAWGWYRVKELP